MKKRALLIGNKSYEAENYERLPGVDNDIDSIDRALKSIGFDVEYEPNVSSDKLSETLINFFDYSDRDNEDINIIYYTGHGATKENHLCLVTIEDDTEENCVDYYSLEDVIEKFEGHTSRLIIILDMCRTGGLDVLPSEYISSLNVAVIYATGANAKSAIDSMSIFSRHFAENVQKEGQTLASVVKMTHEDMIMAEYDQQPCFYSTALGDVILCPIKLEPSWFAKQNEDALIILGPRYAPNVNVSVGIEKKFDAVCFESSFLAEMRRQLHDHLSSFHKPLKDISKEAKKTKKEDYVSIASLLQSTVSNLISYIDNYLSNVTATTSDYRKFVEIVKAKCNELTIHCRKLLEDEQYENLFYGSFQDIAELTDLLTEYVSSKEILIAFEPRVFLYGEGGIGKSHSLAHLVYCRKAARKPTILLLGQLFTDDSDPFIQIMNHLHLEYSFDVLLYHLNEYGKKLNTRVLICIDALNEGMEGGIWENHLTRVINTIARYPWIALIVSGRTYFYNNLKQDGCIPEAKITGISHSGFTEIGFSAIEKYFSHYGVEWDPALMLNREFSNPLFLKLFCEGYIQGEAVSEDLTPETIYNRYLRRINRNISKKCGYSDILHNVVLFFVQNVQKAKIQNNKRVLDENDYSGIINDLHREYYLRGDLFSALLDEGVISVKYANRNKKIIYVTYERLEDYFVAKIIYDEYVTNACISDNSMRWLQSRPEILREFICILANSSGKEIDELISESQDSYLYISAFVDAIPWRKSASFGEHFFEYVQNSVLLYDDTWVRFFDTLTALSSKIDHPLNGDYLHDILKPLEMYRRDEIFVPLWSSIFNDERSITVRYFEFLKRKELQDKLSSRAALSVAKSISWFLISTDSRIRNSATELLTITLMNHIDICVYLLEEMFAVNDPYVPERVLAAVFGAVTYSNDKETIMQIAIWVYEHVFCTEQVVADIVIRDFAKDIVDYAKNQQQTDKYNFERATPPYLSAFPPVPSDEEIEGYKDRLGYKVMHSMKVEYDRKGNPGGYGDFGRYTFQNYFRQWHRQLDYNDLMNIALKNIYDRGYDVKIHGEFDDRCRFDRGGRNSTERIGKKYQWLALYELAARVVDNYIPDQPDNEYYHVGVYSRVTRNYDPTFSREFLLQPIMRSTHNSLYQLPQGKIDTWLSGYDDFILDNMTRFLTTEVHENSYFLLNGGFSWKNTAPFGYKDPAYPYKSTYLLVNMYLCHENEVAEIAGALEHRDLMGRWMVEGGGVHGTYAREMYWSTMYKSLYEGPWFEQEINGKNYELFVPCTTYSYSFSEADSQGGSTELYYPCTELAEYFVLRNGNGNTDRINQNGELVAFDSREILHEDIGFYFKQDEIIEFAKAHHLVPLWTILGEKTPIDDSALFDYSSHRKRPHISGAYYLKDEHIVGKCKIIFE